MGAGEVIESYHDLWRVEQSFRMSKTDLRARPMFHHTRDAIEAHLTVVFAALALARHLQEATGLSIRKIVQTLRPLQSSHHSPAKPCKAVPDGSEIDFPAKYCWRERRMSQSQNTRLTQGMEKYFFGLRQRTWGR